MPHAPKIATCCYCGTRTALVLGGEGARHELSCGACGAPLHAMKRLKADAPHPPRREGSAAGPARPDRHEKPRKTRKKKKKRKSRARWFLEEVVDMVEDVFD